MQQQQQQQQQRRERIKPVIRDEHNPAMYSGATNPSISCESSVEISRDSNPLFSPALPAEILVVWPASLQCYLHA